jgi:hypothetical protein
MQITIYSGTVPAHFHPHQIWFVTRLCVTVEAEVFLIEGIRKRG